MDRGKEGGGRGNAAGPLPLGIQVGKHSPERGDHIRRVDVGAHRAPLPQLLEAAAGVLDGGHEDRRSRSAASGLLEHHAKRYD